jgi:hypothetical protein
MIDTEIPENQWQQFCESFTRQHHGWLVSICQIETRERKGGPIQPHEGVALYPGTRPLQEIREGREGERIELMVTVGEGTDETSFLIEDAVTLYGRSSGHADEGLRIDCANGTTTLIEFRTPAEPETLDGLAESER